MGNFKMEAKYWSWIQKYVDQDAPCLCREVSLCMCQAFPELTPVWGEYHVDAATEPHAWCVNRSTGERVDPTAFQLKDGGWYRELRDMLGVPDDELAVIIYDVRQSRLDTLDYGELEEGNTFLARCVLGRIEEAHPFRGWSNERGEGPNSPRPRLATPKDLFWSGQLSLGEFYRRTTKGRRWLEESGTGKETKAGDRRPR